MKLNKFLFFLIATVALSLFSCDKSNDDSTMMTFQSYEGLEDCGFFLTLNLEDEWRTLEPINLSDFDVVPSEGLEVCGTFIDRKDLASTCQFGEIVELTSLSVK